MFKSGYAVDFCSQDLEREVLDRFRSTVAILPPECKIFREPWDTSTVLCLDFSLCPYHLEPVKEQADILIAGVQEFCLGRSILFRNHNQLKAFRQVS